MPPHNGFWLKPAPEEGDDRGGYSYDLKRQLYNAELRILQRLGPHPRIVTLRAVSSRPRGLVLTHFRMGDLGAYITAHLTATSLPIRLQWIMDIAEGLRYLHSKGVAWNDGHFCNMLLTEDLRIVLCDFGISSCPALNIPTSVLPGDLWRSPRPEPGTPRQDVFALATAAFVLLMGRWPHLKTFEVKLDDIEMVYARHVRGEWDRGLLAVPGCRTLGEVLLRCWRGDYVGTDSVLAAVVEACELCKRRLA